MLANNTLKNKLYLLFVRLFFVDISYFNFWKKRDNSYFQL